MDQAFADSLRAALGIDVQMSLGMPVLQLQPAQVGDAARVLRDRCAFDMLLDVTAVDWPEREPRFDVVWHFFSSTRHARVRIKTRVGAAEPVVTSLVPLFGSAAFMERECHDMFGIRFSGNADLRPILMYEGFVGHPLRKDYPKHREQPLVPYRNR